MKSLITVLFVACALSTAGCYQIVSSFDIEKAEKVCGKIDEKIVEISATFAGDENVRCTNNKKYSLNTEL